MTRTANTKKHKAYGREQYAVIAVDVVVFALDGDTLKILLQKTNKKELKGAFAVPGALVGQDESLEEAAERVLAEKVGLEGVFFDQLATFGDPERDPFGRVVSVAYIALLDTKKYELHAEVEMDDVQWVSVKRLPTLAYDHKEIAKVALTRLRGKLEYTNIVQGVLPREFTLTELQHAYEVILDHELDKRNFRKKILALKLVKETGKKRSGGASRPAALYTFVKKKLELAPGRISS